MMMMMMMIMANRTSDRSWIALNCTAKSEWQRRRERKRGKKRRRVSLSHSQSQNWMDLYLHASQHHQKRKKKASRFYPTYQPYLLTFFFHSLRQYFFLIFFGIGLCMYAYLTLLKVCAYLWVAPEKEFIRKYWRMMVNGIERSMVFFFYLSSSFLPFLSFLFIHLLPLLPLSSSSSPSHLTA